ncbi:hypothetical protein KMP13_02265 [Epibacterium ulvae]|nr:hypothetical protein [Epibacterium ulvae]
MWFSELLRAAFPSQSDRELARTAAKVLDCSERQVLNWLNARNDAPLRVVAQVLVVAKAEIIFKQIEVSE